ncbi:MAG: ARPP-1 family domain-containing protein [Gemmataceae bacterium]
MSIATWLENLKVSAPVTVGGLTIYGLTGATRGLVDYTTLDEAIGAKTAEVTEISESGSVPELRFINKSDKHILLLAGEQLVGAKQNRVLNTTMLVEAGSTTTIPVSCVEQGRWSYKMRGFGSSGTGAHVKLRGAMSEDVSLSYLQSGRATANQGKVWAEVSRKLSSLDVKSGSSSLEDVYVSHRQKIDSDMAALQPADDWCGVVVFCHGHLAAIDCFDRPESLKKYWNKLVRGHGLDAIEVPGDAGPVAGELAVAWLGRLTSASGTPFKPTGGTGTDYRIKGSGVHGNALLMDEIPVHLQAFESTN